MINLRHAYVVFFASLCAYVPVAEGSGLKMEVGTPLMIQFKGANPAKFTYTGEDNFGSRFQTERGNSIWIDGLGNLLRWDKNGDTGSPKVKYFLKGSGEQWDFSYADDRGGMRRVKCGAGEVVGSFYDVVCDDQWDKRDLPMMHTAKIHARTGMFVEKKEINSATREVVGSIVVLTDLK